MQFVLKSTQQIATLYPEAQKFLADATASGLFMFVDSDLKVDAPQQVIEIDRDKAAQLGLSMNQVGNALGGLLGGAYTNYFSLGSRSYKVISQVQQRSRLTIDQVMRYQIATIDGTPIPNSAIARVRQETVPETITHFQQQNSATISGVPSPGVSQAEALHTLQNLAAQELPADVVIDYAGPLRQFVQESSGFVATFGLELIIIFLALSALFESFRDPLVILVSIPMSVAGALVFISLGLGGASLNIYTEVGLVTLMGLISKHGILIVEVANEAQRAGRSKLDAIIYAAGLRLRPILMTTAAMVLGVVPLITASGAGAASRFNMGLVIASGLSIGTLFTLFVLPAVYLVIRGAPHDGGGGGAGSRAFPRGAFPGGASVGAGPSRPRPRPGYRWFLATSSSCCFTCGSFCATRTTLVYSCTDRPRDWIACTASALACALRVFFCAGGAESILP